MKRYHVTLQGDPRVLTDLPHVFPLLHARPRSTDSEAVMVVTDPGAPDIGTWLHQWIEDMTSVLAAFSEFAASRRLSVGGFAEEVDGNIIRQRSNSVTLTVVESSQVDMLTKCKWQFGGTTLGQALLDRLGTERSLHECFA